MAQLAKNPPAMWETWVQTLGWEDPLEKGKATHSSILVWRIPGTIQRQTLFFGAPKSLQMVTAAMKLKDAYSWEGKL